MKVGVGLAAADVGAVAVAEAAAGLLEEVPALVRAAWPGVVRELAGGVCGACAAGGRGRRDGAPPTAAAPHIATAVVATAAPGLARMLSQLARLIACENSA